LQGTAEREGFAQERRRLDLGLTFVFLRSNRMKLWGWKGLKKGIVGWKPRLVAQTLWIFPPLIDQESRRESLTPPW
jgi:hypothetical protein